jgi:hypothetical protein
MHGERSYLLQHNIELPKDKQNKAIEQVSNQLRARV